MEWVVWGGRGVLGGAKGKTECGTQCHGLVDVMVFGHGLFSMISEACSSLVCSVILEPVACVENNVEKSLLVSLEKLRSSRTGKFKENSLKS